MTTTLDLTAKADVKIIHKVGYYRSLLITITDDGVAVPLGDASIIYEADDVIYKEIDSGIEIVDAAAGKFRLLFDETDGTSITTKTVIRHECKLIINSREYPLFDGVLELETTVLDSAS